MTVLAFTITFHTPFRVGAGYGRDGTDSAVDRTEPLPADHLKGVMRDSATRLVTCGALESDLAIAIFGGPEQPSPWSWTAAHLPPGESWGFQTRNRVAIDATTGAAQKDQLVLGEQTYAQRAHFEIHQQLRLAPSAQVLQAQVLKIAAAGVHALGAWRRRGLGWVGISCDAGPVTADDLAALRGNP